MKRFVLCLLAVMVLNASLALAVDKKPLGKLGVASSAAIADLRDSYRDFRRLYDYGNVEFSSSQAELRFRRAMSKMADALLELDGNGDDPNAENYRRTAIAYLQKEAGIFADDLIELLPSFVSKKDFGVIKEVLAKVSRIYHDEALIGYFANLPSQSRRNFKADAAILIINKAAGHDLEDCLGALPSFISELDFEAVKSVIANTNSILLDDALIEFFAN